MLIGGAALGAVAISIGVVDYIRFIDQGELTSAAAWVGARTVVMAQPGTNREELARTAVLQVLGEDEGTHPTHVVVSVFENRERSTLTVMVSRPFDDWAWFFPKPDSTRAYSSWPLPQSVVKRD
ncbi:MAG: hypothetical protein ACJA00_005446 [Myxococcota bacterium]|jgi:hypothetical protein